MIRIKHFILILPSSLKEIQYIWFVFGREVNCMDFYWDLSSNFFEILECFRPKHRLKCRNFSEYIPCMRKIYARNGYMPTVLIKNTWESSETRIYRLFLLIRLIR